VAGPTGATGATGPAGSNATATTDASALVSGTLPDARLSSSIARTSDITTAVANVVNAAPAALDTLNELAAALGNDASFSVTVTNALAAKAPLASPTFTGTVSGNLLAINSAGGFGVNHGLVLNSSGILHQSIVGGLTQTNFVLAPNGTITTGTWVASAIGVAYGGTGATTASAARTNLGLAIGTDVPALSHTHTALQVTEGQFDIARIPTGTTSTTVCIGNDSRLSDARTPTAHVHSGADITSGTVALARLPVVLEQTATVGNSGTSTTLALTTGSVQTVTLSGNCTFTMPTATAGASITLILTQGGSNTASFTSVKWPGGTAPTITTGANKIDVLTFVSDGTNWYGVAVQNLA
jgi:hypothetical protein